MSSMLIARVGVLVAACAGWTCRGFAGEAESAGRADTRQTLPRLVLLPPGTKVDKTPPPGWTHLVLKSLPRLGSGAVESLPGVAKRTATLFRSVLVADVRRAGAGRSGYVLRRIGIGLCMPVNGVDTVVMTAGPNAIPVTLSLIQKKVLGRAEEEMTRGRIKGRTATFALFSAPTVLKVGDAHRKVALRYAFLVDPASGALQTLLWALDADPHRRAAPLQIDLLPPSLVYDCKLDVAAERILDTIPVYWSFAMTELPPGRGLKPSPELRAWTLRDGSGSDEAAAFEAELRRFLKKPR